MFFYRSRTFQRFFLSFYFLNVLLKQTQQKQWAKLKEAKTVSAGRLNTFVLHVFSRLLKTHLLQRKDS